MRRRVGRGIALISAGLCLLGIAWLFATPPFQAPDESAHYLRALTIANGSLLGPREPIDQVGQMMLQVGGWHAAEERWIDHDRRGVSVPARLSPPGGVCLDDRPDLHGSCTEVTYTGDYSPLAYLVPAAAMSPASDATTALWLARAGSLIAALAWLVIALALAGPVPGWSVIGVLAATTPTMLFISAAVNPSGLELAANLALISALGRLRRDGAGIARWAWWALILSGATTILAWQLGPLFAVADLAVFAAVTPADARRALYRTARTRTVIGMLILGAAIGLSLLYGELSGALHSSISLSPLGGALRGGVQQLGPTLDGAVGVFGALTVTLPAPMSEIWWALIAALLVGALRVGSRRERAVLLVTTIVALAFPVIFYAFSYRLSGFGMQGRYAMPVLALIPTLSGLVLAQRRPAATPSQWIPPCLVAIAAFQLVAWWINARHWGVTNLRLGVIKWDPPTGWGPLLAICAAGAIALICAGVPGAVRSPRERPRARL